MDNFSQSKPTTEGSFTKLEKKISLIIASWVEEKVELKAAFLIPDILLEIMKKIL